MDIKTMILSYAILIYGVSAAGLFIFGCYKDKSKNVGDREGPFWLGVGAVFWPLILVLLMALTPAWFAGWIYGKIVGVKP